MVHGKKVDDVRHWFVEALDGGKLRKYRVSPHPVLVTLCETDGGVAHSCTHWTSGVR